MPSVPFKLNRDRRHHIAKQKRKVTNWREAAAGPRQRGGLTVWFPDEAVQAWQAEPRTTRGGQPDYSPLAILTALTLRAVFRLPFRQTEGLIGSVIGLLGLDLAIPHHTTPCRRAEAAEVARRRRGRGGGPRALRAPPPRPPPRGPGAGALEGPRPRRRSDGEPLHLLVDSTGLKLCGAGEWLVAKHGTSKPRSRRQPHIRAGCNHGQNS